MAIAILRPTAEGFYTEWALTAGATRVAAVDPGDPVSHDDNTSYITGTAGTWQHMSFTLTAAPAGITVINSVTFGLRAQVDALVGGPAAVLGLLRLGGVDQQTLGTYSVGVWDTQTGVATRPGGGSWTVADLATLEIGCYVGPGAGGANGKCTSLWIEVDYTTAMGGFIYLL